MKYRFRTKPYKHQKRGLVYLWKRGSGALFWDPGIGKTKTALDYASALYEGKGLRRVLVLCPINALGVWPVQANKHIPKRIPYTLHEPTGSISEKTEQIWNLDRSGDNLHILVLNYETVIKRDRPWDIMESVLDFNPELLILDESHKVKNATAKRSKAAHKLGQVAEWVVLMTGTPIGKNYFDLYSQLKVIDPGIWDNIPWTKFRYKYGVWGTGPRQYILMGYQNLDDLFRRYKPWITSARKRDVADMPKVIDQVIPVALGPQARDAYNIMAEEGVLVWRRHLIDAPIPLTKLLRLQQMTGGWVHDEYGETVAFQEKKLEVFRDKLDELHSAGRKVVVFARFIAEMEAITRASTSRSSLVWNIRGGVSDANRREAIRQFGKSTKASTMVIQIGSAEALDGLQEVCSDAIFFSKDYSLIHYSQARGRIDRVGQKEPVNFYHLHVTKSVDSLVYQALRGKKNLERMVMDDPDVLLVHR